MSKLRIFRWLVPLVVSMFFTSGCVYFNTFFNAKKKFHEAEETQKKNRESQNNSGALNNPGMPRAGGRFQPGGGVRGEQAQSIVTPQVRLLYEDAIKKASKVLKFHPESRYIDDALWLIGKAYFNMGDYLLADRKFQELVINHPNSGYADDSYFYSGLCQIELGNEDLANRAFAKVESLFPKCEYIDDIYFAKGKIDQKDKDCKSALDQFQLYMEKFPKGDSAAKAVYMMGQCQEELGDNYNAYLTYSRVSDYGPDKDLYFDATLASAVAVLKTDSIQIGMEILNDLAKNEKYFQYSPRIRLRIAEGHYLQGDIDKAIEVYNDITVENPKTNESAEAYYKLGLIYQGDLFDIAKAKEAFAAAQSESATSEYRNLALSKSAQIAKLESYQMQLQKADSLLTAEQETEPGRYSPDSGTAVDTSLTVQPPGSLSGIPDSVNNPEIDLAEGDMREPGDTIQYIIGPLPEERPENPVGFIGPLPLEDSVSVSAGTEEQGENNDMMAMAMGMGSEGDNSDSIQAIEAAHRDSVRQAIIRSGIETRFLLAELYAYELNRPDSAITEYLLIVKERPDSPYAVRALLAAANLELDRGNTGTGDSLLGRIVKEYPRTPQAVRAAEILNYPLDLSRNAVGLYARAESLIFYKHNPDSAIAMFRYIADNFPDMAAKALYAIGWTLDNIENVTDSSAYFAYAAVRDKYPETEYADAAKVELGMVSSTNRNRQQRERRQQETEQVPEKPEANPDSLIRLAMELPLAPNVSKLGEFLYPEELLDKDLKGQVIFKIKLDITGRVRDYQIIGPSGERAIDSVATAALLETEFDTSDLDFTQLDSFFRYSISFERPEIDIFNDPYRDRREQEQR